MPDEETYEDLHAIVVDAIRYLPEDGDIDGAAHEALTRLREGSSLPIPARPGSQR